MRVHFSFTFSWENGVAVNQQWIACSVPAAWPEPALEGRAAGPRTPWHGSSLRPSEPQLSPRCLRQAEPLEKLNSNPPEVSTLPHNVFC